MIQDAENPFAATATEPIPPVVEAPRLDGGTPRSIRVAIAVLSLIIVLDVACYAKDTLAGVQTYPVLDLSLVTVSGLLVIGILTRARLAKRAGRLLSLLFAGFLTLIVVAVGAAAISAQTLGGQSIDEIGESVVSIDFVVLLAILAATWVVFWALGTPTATAYFRGFCPQCNSCQTKAVNLLYTKSKCKECEAVW